MHAYPGQLHTSPIQVAFHDLQLVAPFIAAILNGSQYGLQANLAGFQVLGEYQTLSERLGSSTYTRPAALACLATLVVPGTSSWHLVLAFCGIGAVNLDWYLPSTACRFASCASRRCCRFASFAS